MRLKIGRLSTLVFKVSKRFILCIFVSVCGCVHVSVGVIRGQKRARESLELEGWRL